MATLASEAGASKVRVVYAQRKFPELKVLPLFYKLFVEDFEQQPRQGISSSNNGKDRNAQEQQGEAANLKRRSVLVSSISSISDIQFILDKRAKSTTEKIV